MTPTASKLEKVKSTAWFRPFYLSSFTRVNAFAQRIYPRSGNKLIKVGIPDELGAGVRIGFEVKRICRQRDKDKDIPWFIKLELLENPNMEKNDKLDLKLDEILYRLQ